MVLLIMSWSCPVDARPVVMQPAMVPLDGRRTMMTELTRWALLRLPLFAATVIGTHLLVSGSQTLLHHRLGHHRLGGALFRNHIRFHHAIYAKGHLVSSTYCGADGNNTPYFLIPTILVAGAMYLVLPFDFFAVVAATGATSFYAHVYFDKEYHVQDSRLARFAWFRHKQQLHFVHHLHAGSNFAVIDFFWDRLLGTYRRPEDERQSSASVERSVLFHTRPRRSGLPRSS